MYADLRYAVRVLRAHPGIGLLAVLSLALGIGANSTMFSLVDGMYLRPLPVRDPAGLVYVSSRTAEGREAGLSWLGYLNLRQSGGVFADIAAQNRRGGLLRRDGEDELVQLTLVTDNYFPLLGVHAARGRLFREDLDSAMKNEPALAISDSLWRRRFGADSGLVGRTMEMNGRAFTVVGILPPEFHGLERGVRTDVWAPVSTWNAMGRGQEFGDRGGVGQFEPVARLRPGATLAQAQAQAEAISRRWQRETPGFKGRWLRVASEQAFRSEMGWRTSALLLAIVGLLLLIACANVALLLLAQAEGRKREMGIRLALGVSRGRLLRQLMTEGALLALIGTAVALAVARWMIPLLPALLPPGPDYVQFDIRLDGRVLAVTLLSAVLAVLLFGLAPALSAVRTDLNSLIRSGGWGARRRFAGRSGLVVLQAALGVVLLNAAGLLARSFLETQQQRLGFDTDRDILALVPLVAGTPAQLPVVCGQMAERIGALPGVKRVAYCRRIPLSGPGRLATREVLIPGRNAPPGEDVLRIRFNQVSNDYFAVMGTRLLAGRVFTRADASGVPVALVNETMARQFFNGRNPIGEFIRVGNADTQIVGVVEDALIAKVHEPPEPFLYFPYAQLPVNETTFLVETAGDPGRLLPAVKREMRAVQPALRLLSVTSLRQHLKDALYSDWLPAVLSAAIGALGMVLTAAGLFGVVLHSVTRRYRELGMRMALGARGRTLVWLVLRHGASLAGAGAAAGVAVSLVTARLLAGLLYGVSPYDPAALALAVALVLAVALAASFYPAWRATRVDPAAVLRAE